MSLHPAGPPASQAVAAMTAPTLPTTPDTAPDAMPDAMPDTTPGPGAAAGPGCDACPHPVAAHDAISLRFCRATLSGALTRGCSCRI